MTTLVLTNFYPLPIPISVVLMILNNQIHFYNKNLMLLIKLMRNIISLYGLNYYNRLTYFILLKFKAKVANHVKTFIEIIENHYKVKPKTDKTDNGPEFLLHTFHNSKVIFHQRSYV